jgi:hypothetical protein
MAYGISDAESSVSTIRTYAYYACYYLGKYGAK